MTRQQEGGGEEGVKTLLFAQGFQGIAVGRAACGEVTGQQGDRGQ